MHRLTSEQDDKAEFVQLYSKMAQSLAVSGVVGQNPSHLLSIQLPGVVVKPGLNPRDPETEYYVSNFLNLTLECDYVATSKAASVSDVYKLILDGKELPLIELSSAEKMKLKEARKFLFDAGGSPSPAYLAYDDYAYRFYTAQDTLDTAKSTHDNGGPPVSEEVLEAYDRASTEWQMNGYKDDIENALAVIEQLEGRDPFPYWQALSNRYSQYTRALPNGSQYLSVTSFPPYEHWFDVDLWTPFSFDEGDFRKQRRSGGTGMRGGGCCCCGSGQQYFDGARLGGRQALNISSSGFGPGFHLNRPTKSWRHNSCDMMAAWHEASEASEEQLPFLGNQGAMRLDCSFKRINIVRPWMDANVFYSRLWRWSPQSIGWGIDVSTGGNVAGNQTASGVMPVLPLTALLAKDIKVSMAPGPAANWAQKQLVSGKRLRYGPFLLDKAIPAPSGTRFASGAPVGLQFSGAPQIFGYISTIFPECPNPDLTLPWPT
jgi:hypothetical protein